MTGAEIAIGLLAGGTALGAVSAIQQGNAANSAAKYNAAIAERNAVTARQQAAAEEDKQRRLAYMRLGNARAAYGASGVNLEGSPLDVLEQSAAEEELDALTIRYQGDLTSRNYLEQAALDRAQGKNAKMAGYMGAGSAILLGAAQGANMYSKLPKSPGAPAGMYNGGTGTNPLTGMRYGGV